MCIPYGLLYSKMPPVYFFIWSWIYFFQFSSVAQLCLTLCDPMNCSMPGFPILHQLLEFGYLFFGVEFIFLPAYFICSKCYITACNLPMFYSHASYHNNCHQELYDSTILYIWTFSQSTISLLSPSFAYVLNSMQNSFLCLKLPKTDTSSHPCHAQSHFWLFSSVIPTQF